MKEDKFKVWDKKNKIMHVDGEYYISLDGLIMSFEHHEYEDYMEICDWELIRYTGKKDKNGKEIYEGDIIYKELLSPDDMACGFYGAIGVVEEDPCGMGWAITAVDEGDKSFYDRMGANFSFNEIEIRGNKYENPELIE